MDSVDIGTCSCVDNLFILNEVVQGRLYKKVNVNPSCFYLDGIKSEYFGITKGVAQGCTLSPTLFLIFVYSLIEIESKVSFFKSLHYRITAYCLQMILLG